MTGDAAAAELSDACLLDRDPAEVSRARGHARKTMNSWGLTEQAGLTELIVSELTTNAIRHGSGPVEVRLSCGDGALRVDVHDDGSHRPVRQPADADAESGRGLQLLDALIELHGGTRGWIDDDHGPGKSVYVTMPLSASG